VAQNSLVSRRGGSSQERWGNAVALLLRTYMAEGAKGKKSFVRGALITFLRAEST
jgi:hypothetical protein